MPGQDGIQEIDQVILIEAIIEMKKKMKKTDSRLSMLSLFQDEQSLSIEHADVFNHKKVVIL